MFPRIAFDPVLANPLGAAAVAAMLYIDAVSPDEGSPEKDAVWARPSTCLWMSDEVLACDHYAQRIAWRAAALNGKRAVVRLVERWGVESQPWYGDNSRETLRDETFPAWLDHGAIRIRPGIPTTSSRPRWALTARFADLFDPALQGQNLAASVEEWRSTHRTRLSYPERGARTWAPARLAEPAVATDGPVTEDRRAQLIRWAEEQNIPLRSCEFLSAFISRNDQAARRRLKDIATNTYAWYADEPFRELAWYEIPGGNASD